MRLIITLLLCFPLLVQGAAFTSKATGNWSAAGQTTWNEVGVPTSGDTVTLGAHTVTVDVNTTVGTSPNDATTKVITLVGTSTLVVGTGVTLTVLGNIGHANGSVHTQQAGSTLTFDNSASGGSPVYTFINVGFSKFNFNGSSGSVTTIQAISGTTFGMGVAISLFNSTYGLFKRCSSLTFASLSGNVSIADSTFDSCDRLFPTYNSTTIDFLLDRNTFTNGTHATDDLNLSMGTATTTGVRRISGNRFYKTVTIGAKSFTISSNYFAAGITPTTLATWTFRNNFIRSDGTQNGGNGQLLPTSVERNYFVVDRALGNPHFIAPSAKLGVSNYVSQCIFEGYSPDLVDIGDAIIVNVVAATTNCQIIGLNNLVLPMSYPGTTCASGVLVTLYNTTNTSQWLRNTANVNDSSVGGATTNGMFSLSEAGTGVSNQVAALKSNLAWGSSVNQGFLVMRQTGDVKDIITAANADYNWRYNSKAGDNQLGYEDKAAANTLWTAGDAVAAGVDVHQGSGDPQFYDSTRNIAAWSASRGYGSGYTNGLVALQADVSRIPDLINYVFEGFRPGNSACRNAAHDGACVGAANYYKATRRFGLLNDYRSRLTAFGL